LTDTQLKLNPKKTANYHFVAQATAQKKLPPNQVDLITLIACSNNEIK